MHEILSKDAYNVWYQVTCLEEDKRKWKVAYYATYRGVFVRCNCSMFEILGTLCKHSLYMLNNKKSRNFPTQRFQQMDLESEVYDSFVIE